jgi:hypothetical protein
MDAGLFEGGRSVDEPFDLPLSKKKNNYCAHSLLQTCMGISIESVARFCMDWIVREVGDKSMMSFALTFVLKRATTFHFVSPPTT